MPTPEEQGIIENTLFNKLKALVFKGGLPLLTATPTYQGVQGEMALVDDKSSTRQICSYLNGTWRCADLTNIVGVYELLANKSTDTSLGTSDTLYPTQKAVKTYVDNALPNLSAYYVIHEFTANGTWVCPRGVTSILLDIVGGGGGGGGSQASDSSSGAGGGGGGGLKNQSVSVTALNFYTITVGSAGAASNTTGGNGGNGGNSTAFGFTGTGGGGGQGSAAAGISNATGGTAGDATAGAGGNGTTTNQQGSNGNTGTGGGTPGTGGAAFGGAGGGGGGGAGGVGGSHGGNGGTGTQAGASPTAVGHGGGGAGYQTSGGKAGAAGGQGMVIIKIPISQLVT